jgi:hypothetical protein
MHRDLHHPVRYPNSRHSLTSRRRPYGGSFTSAAWDLTTRQLRLSCGCLHYGLVSTLTADGSSDNTGVSAIVHRPTSHATQATWRACLVSPLAAGASATAASVCACRPGSVIERATTAACWCWPARRRARPAPSCAWPPPAAAPPCGWEQARRPPEQHRRLTHAHATATGVTRRGLRQQSIHGLERSIGGR